MALVSNDRTKVNLLKSRLKELEDKPDFNKEDKFYLALKEKIDNLDKVIEK